MDAFPERSYEGQKFRNLILQGEEICDKEFSDSVFTRCFFHETAFVGCKFRGCEFRECDLSLIRVKGCSFTNTQFKNSKVVGVNWAEAAWGKRALLPSIDFFDCAINYSTFIGLDLCRINLTGCVAKDVDFAEANLTQANCTHTDFSDSRFLHTDLTEADFTGATNYSINANLNVLKRTKFSFSEAMSLLYSLDIVLVK